MTDQSHVFSINHPAPAAREISWYNYDWWKQAVPEAVSYDIKLLTVTNA